MSLNPLVLLNDQTTAPDKFQALLNGGNKAIFLVLGNTAQHQALAAAALPFAIDWCWVVQAIDPSWIAGILTNLTVTADPPVTAMDTWFAACINFSTDIIAVYQDDDQNNITPCFLLAAAKTGE